MRYFYNKEIGKILALVSGGTILEFSEIGSEQAEEVRGGGGEPHEKKKYVTKKQKLKEFFKEKKLGERKKEKGPRRCKKCGEPGHRRDSCPGGFAGFKTKDDVDDEPELKNEDDE